MVKLNKLFILFIFSGFISCLTISRAAAQEISISGSVTDEGHHPMPGVAVIAEGTTTGTSTDKEGLFVLQSDGHHDLIFSFIGYLPRHLKAGDKMKVMMTQDPRQLKDLVVIGYGTASKKEITGAITSIKAEKMNVGVFSTPAELLQGKVAGLNVTKSGDPNKAPSVILRGASTLRTAGGVNDPFYVIDGVPGASIDLVAPADIESIDVLKDASSTAIYGSRASNGVIIVTTKKARAGQSRLSYSAYGSMEKVSKKYDMLSGPELRAYLKKNGQTLLPLLNDDGSNTNWQKAVEKTGYSQNHNISFGKTTENSDYGVSANYYENNGILKNTSQDRTIFKTYINQRFFSDRLKLGLAMVNSVTNSKNIYQQYVLPGMLYYLPTVNPFNADGTYKEFYTRTGSGTLNPLSLADNNAIKTKDNKTLINGIAQLEILPGLKYTLSLSSQKDQNNNNTYLNSQSGLAVNFGGQAKRTTYSNSSTIIESYLNYDHNFGKHSLKLLAGYSYEQDRNNDGFGVTTQGFTNDNLTYNNLYLSNPTNLSQIAFDNNPISTLRLISFYARGQYNYDNKYLLQASIRNDGSSAFGANHRFGYFPAVSAGWRIIKEDFVADLVPFLSDLKLRAGYGVSGNSAGFNAFSALLVYGTPPGNSKFMSNGNITNAIGAVRTNNPDLKWESTGTSNIGLDFGFLNDRITGSVDYYIKKTNDLIDDQLPVSTTQYFTTTYTANVGSITNRGVELMLNIIPVKSHDFTWKTSFNIAHNNNMVNTLSNGQFTVPYIQTSQLGGKGQTGNYSQVIQTGLPLGTFVLWHYMGKDANGVSQFLNAAGKTISTQPLTTDARVAGNAQPKFVFGFTNTFYYKNFDLNFLVRGVSGNKILNATLAGLNDPTDSKIQNIPRFTVNESYKDINAYLISDRFLENGSYLRLDNATLGYTFRPAAGRMVKSVRLYLSSNNLFVLTKYKGIDPEIDMGGVTPGIDNSNFYPKTRTFIVGLNASF